MRSSSSAPDNSDSFACVRHLARKELLLPAGLFAQVKQDKPPLAEPDAVEVTSQLIQGSLFRLLIAPDLHLDPMALILPIDQEVERTPPAPILALNAPASVV
jgi:hypothetical protein